MSLTKQKNLGKETFSALYADLIQSAGRYWIIYIDPVDGTDVGNVHAMEIDPTTLESKETKLIAEQGKISEKVSAFGGFFKQKIFLKSSRNAKFHLLMIDNDDDDFYLSCLNDRLEVVWNSKVDLVPYKRKEISSYEIDDDGYVYIGAINKDGSHLISFTQTGKVSQRVSLEALHPADVQIIATADNRLALAGFYGNIEYSLGVYSAIFNRKLNSINNSQQSLFPDSLVQRLKKDGFASVKKNKYGVYTFLHHSKIVEQADGSLNLITELIDKLGSGNLQPKAAGSIVVSHLSKSPVIFSHIPRYNITGNGNYDDQEYYALPCTDKIFLFYWDHSSNISKKLSDEQTVLNGTGNAVFIGASIGNDGSITHKSVPGGTSVGSIERFYKNECH